MQIENYEITRGLKILTPFIDRILAGAKTMEVRGQNTRIRGRIALIRSRTDLILGTCELVTVRGPYTKEEMAQLANEHRLTSDELDSLRYHKFYGWILENAEPLSEPIRFDRKSGPVMWVDLMKNRRTRRGNTL